MTDVLKLLPPFRWRGIAYPVLARNVSFSHDGAPTRIQYRDGEFIEQLGARSPTFSYTLALREDIAIKDYRNLFTEGLPVLFRDMLDKTRAILDDPVYGSFSCVPQSFDDDTDLQKRDGTDIRVIFTRSVDIASAFAEEQQPTIQGLVTDAGQLDAELTRIDWGQEASPEPSMDALNAISGFGAQIEGNANKGVAALHATAFKLEKIEEQAARLKSPDGFQIQRAARRNRAAATALAKRARDPQRQVVTVIGHYQKTISGIAAEAGMTVNELLDLNPDLARLPAVPPNIPVRVYRADGRR